LRKAPKYGPFVCRVGIESVLWGLVSVTVVTAVEATQRGKIGPILLPGRPTRFARILLWRFPSLAFAAFVEASLYDR
jgi:hypothetical protein